MKTRVKDYLTQAELLCQLAEESAELAQAALKERRTLTNDNPTPISYADARNNLIEEVADVFVCLSELLEIRDWEEVANIREQKENRWLRRLSEKRK